MRWFSGGIGDAISYSKIKEAIFVVYIEGKDEKSQHISQLIELDSVGSILGSDSFVAIKLEAGSVAHQQFGEFYKQAPVPSIYFIGKQGQPIKIITEAPTADGLLKDIQTVLQENGMEASGSLIANESQNVVCENGVCKLPELSQEEKMERAKALLDAKRLQKENEEIEALKNQEIERRKLGQEVQKMKKWQNDQEVKQALEEREKEKRIEKQAKERVLAQIAQDRAERATKFQPTASSTPSPSQNLPKSTDSNVANLQFKLPDGGNKTQKFPSSDKLISVINFVKANFNLTKFALATTFPRRQFGETDHERTLHELELTPNAVLLVLPLGQSGAVSTNRQDYASFIWYFLTPLLGIFNFIKAFLGFGGPQAGSRGDSSSGSSNNRSNSVIHVGSKYDLANRLKSAGSKLVVIDFFANWCGPCRMIAPELDRMARDFPTVIFLKVDVDQNGDISQQYGVTAMPTFVFLKNGREVTRVQGADSYGIRSAIQRYK